jgi:SAM-dependent methyltransferase
MPNLKYVGIDLNDRPNTSIKMDLTGTPVRADTFDALICIHVLEHIQDDHKAIQELYRVLKPGGWAIITVPIRLDQKTFEDATIVSPEARKHAFGEEQHVRFYGYDLKERLTTSGFEVQLDLGQELNPITIDQYGLRDDENVFYCTKV